MRKWNKFQLDPLGLSVAVWGIYLQNWEEKEEFGISSVSAGTQLIPIHSASEVQAVQINDFITT